MTCELKFPIVKMLYGRIGIRGGGRAFKVYEESRSQSWLFSGMADCRNASSRCHVQLCLQVLGILAAFKLSILLDPASSSSKRSVRDFNLAGKAN